MNILINLFLFTIVLFQVSCSSPKEGLTSNDTSEINSLDLSSYSEEGIRLWNIRSPRATYYIDKNYILTETLVGTLFTHNKPNYKLSSQSSKIFNEGERINLGKGIKLVNILKKNWSLEAENAFWIPKDNNIKIDKNPLFRTNSFSIISDQANFDSLKSIITMSSNVQIESQSKNYLSPEYLKPKFRLSSSKASLNTITGTINSIGPITGIYKSPNGLDQENINGKKLIGNLNKESITLLDCYIYNTNRRYITSDLCTFTWSINLEKLSIPSERNYYSNYITDDLNKPRQRIHFQSETNRVYTKLNLNVN